MTTMQMTELLRPRFQYVLTGRDFFHHCKYGDVIIELMAAMMLIPSFRKGMELRRIDVESGSTELLLST